MNLIPAPGKYIVQLDPQDEQTVGGIFLPGTAIKDGNFGTVVAVSNEAYRGPHGYMIPTRYHIGDRVVIGRYSGVRIDYEGQEYVVLNTDEVLACVSPIAVS